MWSDQVIEVLSDFEDVTRPTKRSDPKAQVEAANLHDGEAMGEVLHLTP